MTTNIPDLTRTIYTAFNERDFDTVIDHATDDVRVIAPSLELELDGPDGLRGFLEGWAGSSSDLRVTVERSFVSGDHIINQIVGRGAHDGVLHTPWGAIEPTGITFTANATEMWDIRDGRVSVLRSEADMSSLLAQLGYAPDLADIGSRVREFYDTLNEGSIEDLEEFFAADFISHEQMPGFTPDREGTLEMMAGMRHAFPDLRMTVDDVIVDADTAVVRIRMSGTHRGPFMDIPATNRSFEVEAIDIVKLRDGVAVEHWGVTDTMAMMEQLGLTEAPTTTTP